MSLGEYMLITKSCSFLVPEESVWNQLHNIKMLYYTIIDFNEVDIRIYKPEQVIINRGR